MAMGTRAMRARGDHDQAFSFTSAGGQAIPCYLHTDNPSQRAEFVNARKTISS